MQTPTKLELYKCFFLERKKRKKEGNKPLKNDTSATICCLRPELNYVVYLDVRRKLLQLAEIYESHLVWLSAGSHSKRLIPSIEIIYYGDYEYLMFTWIIAYFLNMFNNLFRHNLLARSQKQQLFQLLSRQRLKKKE